MNKIIRRIVNALEPSVFEVNIKKQKAYIDKLGEAKDDFERSYYQYLCQMFLKKIVVRLLYNLAAMFSLIILRFSSWNKPEPVDQDGSALLLFSGNPDITPDAVIQEYGTPHQEVNWLNHHYLSKQDREYIRTNLKKYRFSFYFMLKSILKIAVYSFWIETYSPKSVIVSSEYSFTSSLLTNYCNFRGVEHINVMHGEKMYYIRDSYFRFNTCYIWDSFYKELFCDMNAEPSQFQIAKPPKLIPEFSRLDERKTVDYTYYLGGETRKEIDKIVTSLRKLQQKNMVIALRPHPIYTDTRAVERYSEDFEIENTGEISIKDSLSRTKHAIALYSTVLQEAMQYGVEIVIDDIIDPRHYSQLNELRYKLIHEKHAKLSDEINSTSRT